MMPTPGPDFYAFSDEMLKLSAMTREEAQASLGRLKKLEEKKSGEMTRGALVGAALFPVGGALAKTVAGTLPLFRGGRRLKSFANLGQAASNIDTGKMGRTWLGDAIIGAVGGGALPVARHQLERNVERERLKDYLSEQEGKRRGTGMRQQFARRVGI